MSPSLDIQMSLMFFLCDLVLVWRRNSNMCLPLQLAKPTTLPQLFCLGV